MAAPSWCHTHTHTLSNTKHTLHCTAGTLCTAVTCSQRFGRACDQAHAQTFQQPSGRACAGSRLLWPHRVERLSSCCAWLLQLGAHLLGCVGELRGQVREHLGQPDRCCCNLGVGDAQLVEGHHDGLQLLWRVLLELGRQVVVEHSCAAHSTTHAAASAPLWQAPRDTAQAARGCATSSPPVTSQPRQPQHRQTTRTRARTCGECVTQVALLAARPQDHGHVGRGHVAQAARGCLRDGRVQPLVVVAHTREPKRQARQAGGVKVLWCRGSRRQQGRAADTQE